MTDIPVIIKRVQKAQESTERKFQFSPDFNNLPAAALTLRSKAWEAFQAMPLPMAKDEAWRRTDVGSLPVEHLMAAKTISRTESQIPAELLVPVADSDHGGQLVIEDGQITCNLDDALVKQGVVFTDLRTAWENHENLIGRAATSIAPAEDKFAALALAMAENGVFLYIPKNVKVENPLHCLVWVSGEGKAHFTNVFILLDDGAEVTFVYESASPQEETRDSMHAGVMEINVGVNAKLHFVELQSWGENMWNFTHERVNVQRDGNVEWIFGALGSKVTKNFSDLNLQGEGSTGKVSGFYFTHGKQHLDHDTQQNHLNRNTTSDLLYKGALVGESRSVWQGMIYVAPNATKTDGYQANRNLLLDSRSRADSIPGLEILTDDVRCTHGATVGKIDADELFYLESRGLPRKDAERLIVEGFFDPIMQRIPFEGVKARFQRAILEKMQG